MKGRGEFTKKLDNLFSLLLLAGENQR